MSALIQATTTAESLDEIAAAIVRHLHRSSPPATAAGQVGVHLVPADGSVPGAVLVDGVARPADGGVVAAAVDDDLGCHQVVHYAARQAISLGVPLRLVHVWGEHGGPVDADRLLSEVLDIHGAAEREILHDRDVARALTALSRESALLVVAARSRPAGPGEPLGDMVRELAGQTACPLAVLDSGFTPADRR